MDTSVASFMLDARPEFDSYRADIDTGGLVYISFQTVAELRFGALNRSWGARRVLALETFIVGLDVVGYTDQLASLWAEVMRDGRRVGRRLEAGDAWIAATARLLDVPLLTHDRDLADAGLPSLTVVCHA